MKESVTVIVPAYNEEKNIVDAIDNVNSALNKFISDYEILIFDDGSKDKTGEIADKLAKENKRIKVIHNLQNRGLGYNYIKGIELASKEFLIMIPGDNDFPSKEIRFILDHINKADIIIPYYSNEKSARSFSRLFISKVFIHLMNILMGLDLKCYTSVALHKTKLVKQMNVTTHSFAYQSEILSKLLKLGYSFMEIGVRHTGEREYGKTKMFNIKNFIGIFKTILYLFFVIRIKEKRIYNKKPIRIR